MQDKQFKWEIKNLEAMQQSAYEQMRFHRYVQAETQSFDCNNILPIVP